MIFRFSRAIFAVEFFNIIPKMPLKHTIIPFLLLLTACAEHEPLKITRLDLAPADSLISLREQWREAVPDYFPEREGLFADIIARELPPLDSVENVLGYAFAEEDVEVVGIINPFSSPIVVKDKTVFVGLNHYLGSESQAYNGFPEFIRRNKRIERLPIDVVEEYLLNKFRLSNEEDVTTLQMLLYIGAIERQALRMLPKGTSEAVVIGMTDEEYDWCRQNEQRIWQQLIKAKLLYSTDADVQKKLFLPSPAATIINANAPGNAARYIGLKIAQAYEAANGDIVFPTAEYVLNNQTLIKSKYSPENATR